MLRDAVFALVGVGGVTALFVADSDAKVFSFMSTAICAESRTRGEAVASRRLIWRMCESVLNGVSLRLCDQLGLVLIHGMHWLLIVLFALVSVSPAQEPADVVVYGGTSAGVIAAIEVAKTGRKVVLVEPTMHLGGLSTAGLGATDVGNKGAIGGLAREFYRRVRAHYDRDEAWTREARTEFRGRGHREGEDTAWTFEPKVAEMVFEAMLAETEVEVVRGLRIDLERGVTKEGARIVALRTVGGREFRARMFIDATYEGDLLAQAGVSFTVGRESNAQYDETLNGNQVGNARYHQFVKPVDPYLIPGDASSGLLPGIESGGAGVDGEADHRLQAYCFRLCATDVAANRRAWPKPADYDEARYELLLRNLEAGDHRRPWDPVRMPNRKTDSNNNFAVSTDYMGHNYDYPRAGWAERDRIIAAHKTYQQGLFWTLANHVRSPEVVRDYFSAWGLAADEFVDNDNWPYQFYVREGRRMVSAAVMTERHCRGFVVEADPVGMGAYGMDSHNVRRYVDKQGHVRNEGDVQVHGFSPYGISYRSIVPRLGECDILLVPVAVSATHIAFGSIRMEPVFMVLGQSAGAAACLALETDVAVQAVDYPKLRSRLLAKGQALNWEVTKKPAKGISLAALAGVVVDDGIRVGTWRHSSSVAPFVGTGYWHDGNVQKGRLEVRFAADLPAAGRYSVRFAYSAHTNRASNVPVELQTADGARQVQVDETKIPAIDGIWHELGVFRFDKRAVVHVFNRQTDGYTVVDAVQFVPVPK